MADPVIQLPYRIIAVDEDLPIRLQRNFDEIVRLLGMLQVYENKTGKVINEQVAESSDVWDRANNITAEGKWLTSKLEGAIDTALNLVLAGAGNVTITDNNGILIVDNKDAPTRALRLLGGVFAIANSKDQYGNWQWKTFGTGDGFTADLLTSGKILTSLINIVGDKYFTKILGDGFRVYDKTGSLAGHFGHYQTLADQIATFTRNSVAYKQDGSQVASGVPRYEYIPLPAPVWQDLFDTDQLSQYTSGGDTPATWAVSDGVLTATGGTHATLTKNGLLLQDCEIVVNSDQAHDGGIVARYQDNNNYYRLALCDDSGVFPTQNLRILKRVNGGTFTEIAVADVTWPRGTSKQIKFSCKGSTLEAYFDGVKVISVTDTTFTGGQVGLRNNSATEFRALDFSVYYAQQGVMSEEEATNALSYAFTSDTDLLQYFTDTHSESSVTIDDTQTPPLSGQKVVKHYAAVNDSYIEAKDADGVSYGTATTAKLAVTGGTYVTFSIWAKGQNGEEQIEIIIFDYASDTGSYRVRKSQTFTITNTWQRYVVTVQTASDAVRAWARVDNNKADQTVYWCAPQLENKAYATSFTPSIRSPETLTIPTAGVINPLNAWTLEWLVRCGKLSVINHHLGLGAIWDSSAPNNRISFHLRRYSSPYRVAFWSSATGWYESSVTVADDSDVYIAFAYDGAGTLRILVNGQLAGTFSVVIPNANYDSFVLGRGSSAEGLEMLNQLIDDLRISSRARTDAEIADAYNSGAPLPIDEWTTYKMNYNNNLLPAENNISFPLDITRIEAMAYNDSYWLISGDTGIIKKYDGSVVTDLTTEFGLSGTKVNTIDWNGSYWLVGGDNGQIKRYSGTAVTDITETLGFGTSAIKAISHNTLYWLIGGSDGKIKKYDGSGVTDVTTDIDFGTDSINAIEYNGSYFLVAGTSGKIKKYDGTTVTDLTATFEFGAVGITSIKYGDSYFLVGANDGKIKKYDGTTVTDLTASFNLSSIQSISYNGTYWLVSSANGVIKKYDGGAVTDISNIVCLYGSEAPVIDFSSYFLMNANSRTIEFHNFPDFYTYKWFSPVIDVSNSLDKSSGHIDIKSTIVGGGTVSGFSRSSADGVTWSDWVAALADGTLQHPADNYVQVGVKIKKADNNIPYVDTVTVSFDGQAQATLLYSAFSSGGQFFMETFMDTCIIVNGIDPPMKYNGTTITELGGYPPNASYATVHKNRLWLAKGSTLYFSNILDFETWEATNFIQINPNDGDTITGLKQYGDYLIITKQHSMWLLVGDGKTTFAVRRIHSDRGCYSPRSLIVVEGNICFVSDDGIYFSDLIQSILISERIRNYWNSLNLRRLNICASHYKNHALYIAAPSGSSMVNNTVIVFDMLRKAFKGIRTGWNVSCWADFREAGQITTLFGHSDKGQISKIETGYSDNGSPYVMLWRSKEYDFDLPGIYKRWNRIYIDLKPSQYSAEITLTFFVDGVQVGSTVLNVPPAEAENTVYSILALASRAGVVGGRKLAIQLAQQILDNPVGIHRISIEYVVHGVKPKLYF